MTHLASAEEHESGLARELVGEAKRQAAAELSRVRRQTAIAKAPLVAEHVRDMLESGVEKVIVFAHHVNVVDTLRSALAEFGTVEITRSTPVGRRQEAVDAFQSKPR